MFWEMNHVWYYSNVSLVLERFRKINLTRNSNIAKSFLGNRLVKKAVWTDPGNGDIPGSAKSKRQENTSPPCAITKPCPSSMGDHMGITSVGDSQKKLNVYLPDYSQM